MNRYYEIEPRALRNARKGERAFIIGNGPSILEEDLSFLRDELTIGMNASTLLESRFGFISSYYTLSDSRFLSHPAKRSWGTTDLAQSTVRVLRADLREFDDQALATRTCFVNPLGRDGFSANLAAGFYFGCTTAMLAIQLAVYLGSSDIFLLGVDLRYPTERPRFYAEASPDVEDAFTSVQMENIINAKTWCSRRGIGLHNCSARSFLRPYLGYTALREVAPQ